MELTTTHEKTGTLTSLSAGLVTMLALVGTAPTFAESALDGFDPNVSNGIVRAIVVQSDGKVVIGGDFTHVGGTVRSNIARLNVDGTVDTSFNPGASVSPDAREPGWLVVKCLALQPDGKILVGGRFNSLGGQLRNCIGRLNADGSLDAGFDPGADGTFSFGPAVWTIAVQSDEKILVGGRFGILGGQPRNCIGRLNADGTVDEEFRADAGGTLPFGEHSVFSLAVQEDGKILVGGRFTMLGGLPRNHIGRLNPDGSVDNAFDPGADINVENLLVQSDGRILVAGAFAMLDGQPRRSLGRLLADGRLDTSFNALTADAPDEVVTLALQADGKILLGGDFEMLNGQPRLRLARLNTDGSLNSGFTPEADSEVSFLAVQPDGKVLVGGDFTTLGGLNRNRIGRLHADGSVDATLNPGADNEVVSLATQPDGKIVVGGYFTTLGGQSRSNLARLNPDGALDTAFNPGADDFVYSVSVQADGKIFVGGEFTLLAGQPRQCIGRLNADGSLDSSFNPGAEGTWPFGNPEPQVFVLALQPDGKILVGGYFTMLGGQPRNSMGRLNADGSLDAEFDPGAGAPTPDPPFVFPPIVSAFGVQADGKILVGGSFVTLGGLSRTNLGRLNPDGSLDGTFNPVVDGPVFILTVLPDGKILIGGGFEKVNGAWREGIARLHPDGSLDADFIDPRLTEPGGLAVQADGRILVVGDFTRVAGQPRNHLVRLHPDGSLDPTFDPGADRGGDGLALQADGKILVGGAFNTLGGQPRSHIGRLSNSGAALQSLTIDANGTMATWSRSGTAPEIEQVTFERSDDGTHYVPLGRGVRVAGGWQVSGLSLPTGQSFYLRARGRVLGAGGLIESVALFWRLPPPFLSSVMLLGNGVFQFSFTNTNAAAFTVLASTNVALPAAQWEVLDSPVSVGGGVYQFNDTDATNHVRRFYQLRTP